MWWHVLWWTFREKRITYDFSRCITFIRNVCAIPSICMLTHKRKMHLSYDKPFNHGNPCGKKGVGVSPEILVPASIKNFFPTVQKTLVGQGLLIIEASRPHSITHARTHAYTHSVRLFWKCDQPDAETSNWQHITFTRGRHTRPRRDSNPQPQQPSSRRPTA